MNEEAGIIIGFSQHNSRLSVTEILILTVVGIHDILILAVGHPKSYGNHEQGVVSK